MNHKGCLMYSITQVFCTMEICYMNHEAQGLFVVLWAVVQWRSALYSTGVKKSSYIYMYICTWCYSTVLELCVMTRVFDRLISCTIGPKSFYLALHSSLFGPYGIVTTCNYDYNILSPAYVYNTPKDYIYVHVHVYIIGHLWVWLL